MLKRRPVINDILRFDWFDDPPKFFKVLSKGKYDIIQILDLQTEKETCIILKHYHPREFNKSLTILFNAETSSHVNVDKRMKEKLASRKYYRQKRKDNYEQFTHGDSLSE